MSKLGGIASDTEVLTPFGWKPLHALRDVDVIMGYNPETQAAYFQEPLSVSHRRYTGIVYMLESNTYSLVCSKEQQIPYLTGSENFTHCNPQTLRRKNNVRIPVAGFYRSDVATDLTSELIQRYVRRFQMDTNVPSHQIANSFVLAWSPDSMIDIMDKLTQDCAVGKGFMLCHRSQAHLLWLQTMCHLTGRKGSILKPPVLSKQYRVRIRHSENVSTKPISFNARRSQGEDMTAVQLPSNYMFIRHHNKISIIGAGK